MPSPRFETPTGVTDKTNVDFYVSRPYANGSTAVFLNGVLMERTFDDGWIELDPETGLIRLKEAPFPFDTLQIFYLDRSPPLPETVVYRLKGRIKTSTPISGKVHMTQSVTGRIVQPSPLVARIAPRKDLRATITSRQTIRAKIRMCA